MELGSKGQMNKKGLATDSISEKIKISYQKMQKLQCNTGLEGLLETVTIRMIPPQQTRLYSSGGLDQHLSKRYTALSCVLSSTHSWLGNSLNSKHNYIIQ